MTREYIEQLNNIEPNCFENDREEQWFNIGLQYGLEAADAHPKSPWISVKDDLPYKHEELILNKEHPFLTNKVLIKTEVRVHIAFMIKDIIKDKWIWYGYGEDENQITHWMPIPELPKE